MYLPPHGSVLLLEVASAFVKGKFFLGGDCDCSVDLSGKPKFFLGGLLNLGNDAGGGGGGGGEYGWWWRDVSWLFKVVEMVDCG